MTDLIDLVNERIAILEAEQRAAVGPITDELRVRPIEPLIVEAPRRAPGRAWPA
jgi:hypothetical protein